MELIETSNGLRIENVTENLPKSKRVLFKYIDCIYNAVHLVVWKRETEFFLL